ncbi:hypothetical protein ACMA5K_24340 [Bradyrhizobium diazoefficiens]|uniref:hypothetical protein n=1 Tax=Bradyrhizobium diazoefficiens TaxID=1355477 RepID=UPI00117808FD|nr:hypothetical protein [Bradyrhizobium diazoefficiens]QLD43872.1 hypothetical protein HUW42_24125 [Bradyrhizobium diazoefficiens]
MTIKTAEALLNELIRSVRPPSGCPMQITELKPATSDLPNWAASVRDLPRDAHVRYESAVIELRRQNLVVDWEGVPESPDGERRIIVDTVSSPRHW